MAEKEQFIVKMQDQTKQFIVNVIDFCESLKSNKAAYNIPSQKKFFSKKYIGLETVSASKYWLEITMPTKLSSETDKLDKLLNETHQIVRDIRKIKTWNYNKN